MRAAVLGPVLLCLLSGDVGTATAQFFELPPLPVPSRYGHLSIDRVSSKSGQLPVTFSHWSHRTKYTCRVCHFELEFEMETGATEITEEKCRNGKYCGAASCHDGKSAFGHTKENCRKCHSSEVPKISPTMAQLFPQTKFGSKIDWVQALEKGLIRPRASILDEEFSPMPFKKVLKLEAGWEMIPPAIFSHEIHNRWLDCANCHPDVFNVKKKTTKHFEMRYILQGKFCGLCHLKVAFPLNDCTRCHPGMKSAG